MSFKNLTNRDEYSPHDSFITFKRQFILMKNIHLLITLVSISIFSLACQPAEPFVEYITEIDSEAVGPYFTKDHEGNPVLCWTELDIQDSLYRLKYAIYDAQSATFGNPITVAGSEGSSTAAESMSK